MIIAKLPDTAVSKLNNIDNPKVGDWVAIKRFGDKAAIEFILPRRNELFRRVAGVEIEKQIMVTNVDLAFIVQPLDHGFSLARIERFLFQLNNQNIETVVLLNKSDLVNDYEDLKHEVEGLGIKVIVLSALNDANLLEIRKYIKPRQTAVILGQSGAGKSTLLNKLVGDERQKTQSVRSLDNRGRHTTVHRELFLLPCGGLIIDTPGIRELQLWGDVDELNQVFPEIMSAISNCFYKNCSHTSEDRCAIKAGLNDGSIDSRRYSVYCNFKQELSRLSEKLKIIKDRQTDWSKLMAKKRRTRIIERESNEFFDL